MEWKNSFTIRKGDTAYLYLSSPYGEIRYKCIVVNDKVDDELLSANSYAIPEKKSNNYFSKKEKYIECWLEGSRFPDVVRWGIADKELAENSKYIPNFCDALFSKGEAKHRGYIDESDATWCTTAHPEMGFKKGKHDYFPIPFDEKKVNPNVHDWNAQ